MNRSTFRPRARTGLLTTLMLLAGMAGAAHAGADPVLMVISNQDFWYADYGMTRSSLEAQGLEVVVAAATTEVARPLPGRTGEPVQPDLALADVSAEDYSAVVFVGGWGASSYQYAFEGTYHNSAYRPDPKVAREVNRLIEDFRLLDRTVAALSHGVTVLAWARVDGVSPLEGRIVVGFAGGMPGFRLKGVDYADAEVPVRWQVEMNGATMLTARSIGDPMTATDDVYVDGRIITAESYESAALLAELLAEAARAADRRP